jgi:hypothetical protein
MEFTSPQERNEYIVGRLFTIACKSRPSLEGHFWKYARRPDLLFPMMCLKAKLWHNSRAQEIVNEMEPCEPLFHLPSNGGALIMGMHHAATE